MGWFAILFLIGITLFWLVRLARFRGARLEWLGAALMIGLAGYAWQGSPGLAGSPTVAARDLPEEGRADLDDDLTDAGQGTSGHWMVLAEAMNRRGDHESAAQIIWNALETDPENADLWVSLGNALLLHGNGQMSPAAQLAFQRAAELDPDHAGPPFFIGLALAQAGQYDEAEQVWTDLLRRSPEDAPYRADLENRLLGLSRALGRPAPLVEQNAEPTESAEPPSS